MFIKHHINYFKSISLKISIIFVSLFLIPVMFNVFFNFSYLNSLNFGSPHIFTPSNFRSFNFRAPPENAISQTLLFSHTSVIRIIFSFLFSISKSKILQKNFCFVLFEETLKHAHYVLSKKPSI